MKKYSSSPRPPRPRRYAVLVSLPGGNPASRARTIELLGMQDEIIVCNRTVDELLRELGVVIDIQRIP